MTTYLIECEKCKIYWEYEGSMDNPPKEDECPECGEMGARLWTAPATHFRGMDFHTNVSKAERYARKGMDKDTANQFLNDAIKLSKARQKESPYEKMYITPDEAVKQGIAKRSSDKQVLEKREKATAIKADISKRVTRKN